MMLSSCCNAALKTEHREELFHGSDDDYALIIPFQICSKCGEIELTLIETADARKILKEGKRKYA